MQGKSRNMHVNGIELKFISQNIIHQHDCYHLKTYRKMLEKKDDKNCQTISNSKTDTITFITNIQYWENCWQSVFFTVSAKTMRLGKPSSRCAQHLSLQSSSSPWREHNDGKCKASCWGPDMYSDAVCVGGVSGVCGARWYSANPALSGLQDELGTKQ